MIVVADTSPVNYLVLIDQAHLLQKLYGLIVVPKAVVDELSSPKAPRLVKDWMTHRPAWLQIEHLTKSLQETGLKALDAGEREAIWLAAEVKADLLIVDDRDARREARVRNLRVTGTLGVLDEAAARGLIDLPGAIERLRQTSFRASSKLLEALLQSRAG